VTPGLAFRPDPQRPANPVGFYLAFKESAKQAVSDVVEGAQKVGKALVKPILDTVAYAGPAILIVLVLWEVIR